MKMNQSHSFLIQDWKRVAFGIGAGILVILAATGGFAWLISREIISREHMEIASAVVLVTGSLVGAFVTGGGDGRPARCVAAGMGIILLLLMINLMFFDGNIRRMIPGAVLVAGSVIAASIMGGNHKGRRRGNYRYPKYSNR